MAAESRFEIASKVRSGHALPIARRHASLSMIPNIGHRKAARDRRARTTRVPGHHRYSRVLPASLADDARGGSDGHPRHRRRDAWRGTRAMRYQPLFVTGRHPPCPNSGVEMFMGRQLVATAEVSSFSRKSDTARNASAVGTGSPWCTQIRRHVAPPSRPRAGPQRDWRRMMQCPARRYHRRCRAPACRSGTGSRPAM
ncbi:hypothetical protein SAMN05216525_110173 [Bradyrhizobium sp. Gha]|nr:hypothetical protein SAMN05216525_110173 [Bradyrhizobium sp. Gha]